MSKIIEEIKSITAEKVAAQQESAKLNFPKIIERIRAAAEQGSSQCIIPIAQMNEYDKKLLESEGFNVRLIDEQFDPKKDILSTYKYAGTFKVWEIKW